MEELNEKKTKYFVIAIIILIILGVLLIVHFNNKQMVKGEEDKSDTPTTTEKVTTTTKKRVYIEEEKVEEVVYKSVIDETNKLVYNYKLTDEITETDVIISKKLEISETLKEKDVIGLFDISLYDANLVKKNVSNSLITIKIPLTEELKAYENYKVVYINDKNEITDEKFEVKLSSDYLEFNTTHLSVFGIIATKKVVEEEQVVDLSKVTVDVKVNDEIVGNVTNILLDKEDKVELVVNNIDENVNVYYGLRATGQEDFTYEKYEGVLELKDAINYKLFVKVSYVENSKSFELGNIGLYDEVFEYDKNQELEKDIIIGEINDEIETPYDYTDKDKNKDIVIDNVTEVVEEDSTDTKTELDDTENTITTTTDISEEITESSATISVNGNIYLVEETDISKLEMTGHLYIDTNQNIIFAENEEERLVLSNLYSITIRSKEFTLNGERYSYEYTSDGNLVIYRVVEITENEATTEKTEDITTSFETIFNDRFKVVEDKNKNELVLEKTIKEEQQPEDEETNTTDLEVPVDTSSVNEEEQ